MVSVPVGEVVAGQPGEDLEDAGGGGRGAAAVFGIYRELFFMIAYLLKWTSGLELSKCVARQRF